MKIVFEGGGDVVVLQVAGNQIAFATSTLGLNHFAPIEGLQLNKAGIIKEHPDLKGKPLNEMREEAIKRFKDKLGGMETNKEKREYLIIELTKLGYTYKYYQMPGWRPKK